VQLGIVEAGEEFLLRGLYIRGGGATVAALAPGSPRAGAGLHDETVSAQPRRPRACALLVPERRPRLGRAPAPAADLLM